MAKPGPKPKGELGTEERARFLELLSGGDGINLALRKMKIHKRRYYLTLGTKKGFRREVKSSIACAYEMLISLKHTAALNGDPKAQEYLITRYDNGRRFEREMKQRRAEFAAKNPQPKQDDADAVKRIIIPDSDDRFTPREG